MVLSSGRCAPCSLASSIEDSTSRPSELRKRTLVLVLGQVVLTEPCGSVSVIRWIIATLRVLPRRFVSRCEPLTLACPLMGYVCRFVAQCVVRSFSCEKLNLADFDERRSAFLHFAGAKRRRAQQKSGFAPLQILLGNIAARIRSLNFVGKVTGVPVPVLAQTPLLGHPRAFQRYFAYQVPHSGRPCNHV